MWVSSGRNIQTRSKSAPNFEKRKYVENRKISKQKKALTWAPRTFQLFFFYWVRLPGILLSLSLSFYWKNTTVLYVRSVEDYKKFGTIFYWARLKMALM